MEGVRAGTEELRGGRASGRGPPRTEVDPGPRGGGCGKAARATEPSSLSPSVESSATAATCPCMERAAPLPMRATLRRGVSQGSEGQALRLWGQSGRRRPWWHRTGLTPSDPQPDDACSLAPAWGAHASDLTPRRARRGQRSRGGAGPGPWAGGCGVGPTQTPPRGPSARPPGPRGLPGAGSALTAPPPSGPGRREVPCGGPPGGGQRGLGRLLPERPRPAHGRAWSRGRGAAELPQVPRPRREGPRAQCEVSRVKSRRTVGGRAVLSR